MYETLKKMRKEVYLVSGLIQNSEKSELAFTVYVRREGRITVPKELRDAYDIVEGDLVECKIRKLR